VQRRSYVSSLVSEHFLARGELEDILDTCFSSMNGHALDCVLPLVPEHDVLGVVQWNGSIAEKDVRRRRYICVFVLQQALLDTNS
jgi:hypothetical protein